jgi:hypothetical protein
MFSDPLPDSVVLTLRTSETAALAAAMIIAGRSPKSRASPQGSLACHTGRRPMRLMRQNRERSPNAAMDMAARDGRRPTNARSG